MIPVQPDSNPKRRRRKQRQMLNIRTFQTKNYGPSAAAVVTATELHKHFDMPLANALKMASVLTICPTKPAFELASYLNKKVELPLITALKIADRRLSQKTLYLHFKFGCQSLANLQKKSGAWTYKRDT